MTEEIIEIYATIKGHVQGVGFRVTAQQLAMRLGIVGTVRNLADGSVEIRALGKRAAIHEFMKNLSNPNGPGKISAISSEEVSPMNSYSDFKIV